MKENCFKLAMERSRRYPAQTITDMDYTYGIALLANTSTQAESLLHSLERAAGGIGLHVNTDKIEHMCFNQIGDISTLKGGSFETHGQVHLPWKQHLINREWHQHSTSKGMDSYQQVINYMEIKSDWQNKTQFFSSSGCVDTAMWMHHIDTN